MTTENIPLVDFISTMAQAAGPSSVPDHILANGRLFPSQTLTSEELDYVALIDWQKMRRKQCYRNCQFEAVALPPKPGISLLYTEGYVDVALGIGIDHAWLSVNGKVVDPTLWTNHNRSRVLGQFPDGWAYYGVEMDPEVCNHIILHHAAGPIIDDPLCGWPRIPGRHATVKFRQRNK